MASVPSNTRKAGVSTVAFLAHVDTAPDCSGKDVKTKSSIANTMAASSGSRITLVCTLSIQRHRRNFEPPWAKTNKTQLNERNRQSPHRLRVTSSETGGRAIRGPTIEARVRGACTSGDRPGLRARRGVDEAEYSTGGLIGRGERTRPEGPYLIEGRRLLRPRDRRERISRQRQHPRTAGRLLQALKPTAPWVTGPRGIADASRSVWERRRSARAGTDRRCGRTAAFHSRAGPEPS